MIKTFKDFLNEATLATIKRNIKIVFDIESSKHSEERQYRDIEKGDFISEEEIVQSASKFIEPLTKKILNREIEFNQRIWLYDTSNDLNIVCTLIDENDSDNIELKLITIMRSKNFRNVGGTYKIQL